MKITIPNNLTELASHLSKPVYVVGGYVRNRILGGRFLLTDMDICGALLPSDVKNELKGVAEVKDVSPRIGTILIRYCGCEYEYTTFRRDSYADNGTHTPHKVEFVQDIKADYLRRDFTINSIYADAITGEVLDLSWGIYDLNAKLLRTVRKPEETFDEDGLRLLRLIRFSSELGFDIEENTEKGAIEMGNRLKDITTERKREELNKILASDYKYGISGGVVKGLDYLNRFDLWQYFLKIDGLDNIRNKTSNYGIIESVPKELRVIAFANVLCEKDFNAISLLFGGNGLNYPKIVVKRMLLANTAIYNRFDSKYDSMWFVAQNVDYINELESVAKAFGSCFSPKKVFDVMKGKGLPFEYKDLEISENDFLTYRVKTSSRGIALKEMMRLTYQNERNLSRSEKIDVLNKYGG